MELDRLVARTAEQIVLADKAMIDKDNSKCVRHLDDIRLLLHKHLPKISASLLAEMQKSLPKLDEEIPPERS